MDELSGIAADYLRDLEIIEEARAALHDELGVWWRSIVGQVVQAIKEASPVTIDHWVNKNSPGQLHVYARDARGLLLLQVLDPRHTRKPQYVIRLTSPSKSKLREFSQEASLVAKLDAQAISAGLPLLDWKSTVLLETSVAVEPDTPDDLAEALSAQCAQVFQLVVIAEE